MGSPTAPTWTRPVNGVVLWRGDCLDVLRSAPADSIDAIITDPPYGLGFMGKDWDDLPPGLPWAQECLRVLRPGGHLLAFGGSRTWHRLAVVIEDAGFEVRDSIAWLYGSGFPKSLDVSKAIDKAAGATREVVGHADPSDPRTAMARGIYGTALQEGPGVGVPITAPATPAAQQWQGWGTALKPAFEPIVVGRKPLVGTVAANVLAHGTGALNIDGTRVPSDGSHMVKGTVTKRTTVAGDERTGAALGMYGAGASFTPTNHEGGRWPANVLLDGDAAAELDAQSGTLTSGAGNTRRKAHGTDAMAGTLGTLDREEVSYGDSGGASRFFPVFRYQAKAPARERVKVDGVAHPTVKPLALMRWLVRLVTPPGGRVLDPFAGSGTTGEAALLEGMSAVLIEREADYHPLILARLSRVAEPERQTA